MPHAALRVVQPFLMAFGALALLVSMPHAALWVVQHVMIKLGTVALSGFNAARGFVGGAARIL